MSQPDQYMTVVFRDLPIDQRREIINMNNVKATVTLTLNGVTLLKREMEAYADENTVAYLNFHIEEDTELVAGLVKQCDRLKQQLRDEGDRIAELKRAIESMRVAGGSVEFQKAFDIAKALIVTPNA